MPIPRRDSPLSRDKIVFLRVATFEAWAVFKPFWIREGPRRASSARESSASLADLFLQVLLPANARDDRQAGGRRQPRWSDSRADPRLGERQAAISFAKLAIFFLPAVAEEEEKTARNQPRM